MIDEVGQKYLDELKQAGVVIDDTPETQRYLAMRGARGGTWNDNLATDPNLGAQRVTILLAVMQIMQLFMRNIYTLRS